MSYTVTSPAPGCYVVDDTANPVSWSGWNAGAADVYEFDYGAPFTRGPWWECVRCRGPSCPHIAAAKRYKEALLDAPVFTESETTRQLPAGVLWREEGGTRWKS